MTAAAATPTFARETLVSPLTGPSKRSEADARVGMMIFLASWGMVFLTLFFASTVLRLRADAWPPPDSPLLPETTQNSAWAITAAILASSLALHRAGKLARAGRAAAARLAFSATMLLGCLFFVLQVYSWMEAARAGVELQGSIYGGLFYALTAFHAAHVVAGLGALIWALPSVTRIADAGSAEETLRDRIRLSSAASFWHFVDLAWIATFLAVFLV